MIRIAAALGAACLAAGPALAQGSSPEALLERLFTADAVSEEWFAPEFLAEVPAEQVQQIVDEIESTHGALQDVAGEADRFTITLEGAEVPARIALDGEGRIAGLFFEPPVVTGGSVESFVEEIAGLPGETSALVLTGGEELASHEADAALAVGSVAKLAILRAVDEAVEDGDLAWEQAVPLDPAWRSLPSGILQEWPEDTPVTVASLANLAVSISDNTATDALLDLAGREAVEAHAAGNAPFPSTRELFILKSSENGELREAWSAGDAEAKRAILADIAGAELPAPEELDPRATLEVEWYMTPRDVCTLLNEVSALPAFSINPGMADPAAWQSVAFKGGSEMGVLSLATRLVGQGGATHCVVATWNHDEALEEEKLMSPYRGILRSLRAAADQDGGGGDDG